MPAAADAPSATERPLIALTLGDPSGIGPEIVHAAAANADVRRSARLILIGPASLRPEGLEDWEPDRAVENAAWMSSAAPLAWQMGHPQEAGGRAALAALKAGVELASGGAAAALVTAPVCKEALHLAGEDVEGQTELLARWAGRPDCAMLAIAGKLRVMLLTRHLSLRQALDAVTPRAVEKQLLCLQSALIDLGIAQPRLALAGLNPHAGEGGLLGTEEQEHLLPALAAVRAKGLQVAGPVPPDSVFIAAARGQYDGVLALYHDQAFIPLKLLSEDRGYTLIAGLPYLRLSPVHGTAFDIAGQGCASPKNLEHTLIEAARICMRQRKRALDSQIS